MPFAGTKKGVQPPILPFDTNIDRSLKKYLLHATHQSFVFLTSTLGMYNSLWDSLSVKMCHLIQVDKILEKQGAPGTRSLRVEFVPNRGSCCSCETISVLKIHRGSMFYLILIFSP